MCNVDITWCALMCNVDITCCALVCNVDITWCALVCNVDITWCALVCNVDITWCALVCNVDITCCALVCNVDIAWCALVCLCVLMKGKLSAQRYSSQTTKKITDVKSRMEELILGPMSARSEMIRRRLNGLLLTASLLDLIVWRSTLDFCIFNADNVGDDVIVIHVVNSSHRYCSHCPCLSMSVYLHHNSVAYQAWPTNLTLFLAVTMLLGPRDQKVKFTVMVS